MSGATLRPAGEAPGRADGSRSRALYYDILAEGRLVGCCELRPEVTPATRLYGQAAFTVFPAERGHHYAAQALRLLLREGQLLGLDALTLTCRPENTASRRTIGLAGGALREIAEVPEGHPLRLSGITRVCVYELRR